MKNKLDLIAYANYDCTYNSIHITERRKKIIDDIFEKRYNIKVNNN